MKKNFKLIIEYDGTAYHGWQRQKNDRTIQETIENELLTLTQQKIVINGSGRTDAGVHAMGQVANFSCETNLAPDVIQRALNSLLPNDIAIRSCQEVHSSFHSRYDARSKIYRYFFLNAPHPPAVGRQYVWHLRKRADVEAMREAAGNVVGKHDFKAFEGHGDPEKNGVRHVMSARIHEKKDGRLLFEIEADGFLRHMVRNIAGTLAEAGFGKIAPERVKEIILSKDRGEAGPTAPPQGLFLYEVKYSPDPSWSGCDCCKTK